MTKSLKQVKIINTSATEINQSDISRYLIRNYLMHTIDGGLFMSGVVFLSFETMLPRIVEFLNGPAWVVGLMPVLIYFGNNFLPILTAHKIEALKRVQPLLLTTGFIQRLPFLLTALTLIFATPGHQNLVLIILVLAPLVSGLIGGVSMTAWLELIAKTIPENRRSSLFSVRYIFSSIVGILAGGVIATILNKFPGTRGYGLLHLIAFSLLFCSFIFFSMIKETNQPPRVHENGLSLKQNFRQMYQLIQIDRQLLNYIFTQSLSNGIYIVMPFMTIVTLKTLGKPDSFMGYLVTAQMVGGIFGNVLTGYLGDRFGGKAVMLFFRILFLIICVGISIAGHELAFIIYFFLFGAAFFAYQVGHATLSLELCPYQKRATYLAIIAFANSLSMIFFSLMSGLLWKWFGSFLILAIFTIGALLFSTFYLLKIVEPRKNSSVYKHQTNSLKKISDPGCPTKEDTGCL